MTRHFVFIIFQTQHFWAAKFYMCYEKISVFLWYQNLQKFEKKKLKR